MRKEKLKEWLHRYALPELIGIVFVLVFSKLSMMLFDNIILSAFVATWAENFGFYGTIVYRDLQKRKASGKRLGITDFIRQLRNMLIEFGPAEYLDSFAIRPFYLSFLPYVIPSYSLAIFIGAILADVTYFIPTIISYEFRKKLFRD